MLRPFLVLVGASAVFGGGVLAAFYFGIYPMVGGGVGLALAIAILYFGITVVPKTDPDPPTSQEALLAEKKPASAPLSVQEQILRPRRNLKALLRRKRKLRRQAVAENRWFVRLRKNQRNAA